MITSIKYIIAIVSGFVFLGCSTFYYGYSKAEWYSLTESEQVLAKQEYLQVIEEHNKNIHGDPREEATEAFKERAFGTHNVEI